MVNPLWHTHPRTTGLVGEFVPEARFLVHPFRDPGGRQQHFSEASRQFTQSMRILEGPVALLPCIALRHAQRCLWTAHRTRSQAGS